MENVSNSIKLSSCWITWGDGFPVTVYSGGSKGGAGDTRPPWGSKFFQFHAVFGKIRQIPMLALPLGSWSPLLREILDPPLVYHTNDLWYLWLWAQGDRVAMRLIVDRMTDACENITFPWLRSVITQGLACPMGNIGSTTVNPFAEPFFDFWWHLPGVSQPHFPHLWALSLVRNGLLSVTPLSATPTELLAASVAAELLNPLDLSKYFFKRKWK